MHELSIAQSLLEIVLEEGTRHRLARVDRIRLQIGDLAAVVPEALMFSFELVCRDTIAAGAVIDIETVAVVARCVQCDISFEVDGRLFICPQCGDPALELISGRELSIVSIEGETEEHHDSSDHSRCAQHSTGQ